MPRPGVGNPGNKGNRNATGRPSVKETKEHAEKWWMVHDVAELEQKIASKKYSPWDIYRLRALKSDPVILKNWADKVLADLHDVTSDGEKLEGAILLPAKKDPNA